MLLHRQFLGSSGLLHLLVLHLHSSQLIIRVHQLLEASRKADGAPMEPLLLPQGPWVNALLLICR